jgi:hypothetical protein
VRVVFASRILRDLDANSRRHSTRKVNTVATINGIVPNSQAALANPK